jgi:hypothetical protein
MNKTMNTGSYSKKIQPPTQQPTIAQHFVGSSFVSCSFDTIRRHVTIVCEDISNTFLKKTHTERP